MVFLCFSKVKILHTAPLTFIKNISGFETSVFVTLQILYTQTACNTPNTKDKLNYIIWACAYEDTQTNSIKYLYISPLALVGGLFFFL